MCSILQLPRMKDGLAGQLNTFTTFDTIAVSSFSGIFSFPQFSIADSTDRAFDAFTGVKRLNDTLLTLPLPFFFSYMKVLFDCPKATFVLQTRHRFTCLWEMFTECDLFHLASLSVAVEERFQSGSKLRGQAVLA